MIEKGAAIAISYVVVVAEDENEVFVVSVSVKNI